MKKIFVYLSLLVAVSITATSCKDFLNTEPSDRLPIETAINNVDDAFAALVGVYDAVQGNSTDNVYYGARMMYYGDVRGDYMQPRTAGMRCSATYEMLYSPSAVPSIWNVPYRIINRCNTLIEAIDKGTITGAAKGQLESYKAQALFLRALAHFDLCRVYAKPYNVNPKGLGVPVITKTVPSNYQPARETIETVYAQVIADLSEAIKLSAAPKTGDVGFANYWSYKALLSRVYLYQGTEDANKKCIEVSKEIIEKSNYKLWSNAEYVDVWSLAGTSEMLFEIVNKNNSDWVDRESIGYLYDENGYADIVLSTKMVSLFAKYKDDVRYKLTKPSSVYAKTFGNDRVLCMKYPGRSDNSPIDSRVNNVPILRLSEIYLNAAEAAFKAGDQVSANNYLNAIVKRGNPDADNVAATLDAILEQRALELFGEGHRYFDLIRNGKEVDRTQRYGYTSLRAEAVKFDAKSNLSVLPITSTETDNNPNIEQNPGY